jgi:hypothetical protein
MMRGFYTLPSLPATNAKRLRKGANGSRERAPDDRLRDEAIDACLAENGDRGDATKAGDL